MSTMRMRGLSEANGSWKIICTARRSARDACALVIRVGPALPAPLALGGLEDPRDDAAQRRLAAAGFADQADHLARVDRRGRRRRPRAPSASRRAGARRAAMRDGEVERASDEALRDPAQLEQGGQAASARFMPAGWKQRSAAPGGRAR